MDKQLILLGGGHGSLIAFKNIIDKFSVKALVLEKYDEESDKEIIEYCDKKHIKIIDFCDLENYYADFAVMIGFKRKVTPELLNKFTFVNIHYSLLPKYRGLHSVAWALINGENEIGYTVHEVDEGIDSGDIIYQYSKKVSDSDTSWSIMSEFDKHVGENITTILRSYIDGNINTNKQNNSNVTYVAKRNIYDCYIEWDKNCDYILNLIRAVSPPYPGAFTLYRNKKVVILDAEKCEMKNYEEIYGHVVNIEKGKGIIVKAGDGFIRIKKILIDGNEIQADNYFNIPGIRLGINLIENYLKSYDFD